MTRFNELRGENNPEARVAEGTSIYIYAGPITIYENEK